MVPRGHGTDASDETLVAEFVREKVLRRTRDEIPHSVGVICDALEQTKKVLRVHATIYVEREGQKGIIIGKGGEMIKHIGIELAAILSASLARRSFWSWT